MIPYSYDLSIDKGSTYDLEFYMLNDDNTVPYYLVGTNATSTYSCRMQIRRSYLSEDKLIDLDTEPTTNQYIGDYITFSQEEAGLIKIRISSTTTKELPPGKHFYDIELEDADGVVMKLMKGRAEVIGEITR